MSFDYLRSLFFAGLFVMFTILGTLSHELGHTLVAKWLGYQTTLHYGSMNWHSGPLDDRLDSIMTNYDLKVEKSLNSPISLEYRQLMSVRNNHQFEILIGGPFQTILTGLVGFIILLIRQSKRLPFSFKWLDWLAIFLALFWLREIFNPAISLAKHFLGLNGYTLGDEYRLSLMLQLNEWTFPLFFGLLGFAIVSFVIFKIIPQQERSSFIVGGCIGGLAGYWLWMEVLGPIVLP